MAWQFERFEGAPYLDDYINGELKFHIMFPTDVSERCWSDDPNYLKLMSMPHAMPMPTDFYKMIDPIFNFPRWTIPHSTGYSIDVYEGGVTRNITSDVKDPEHPNVTYVTPKEVGLADFEDLHFVGEYAIRRIPEIPREIRLPANALGGNIPHYALESRIWYTKEIALVDWKDFVKVVGGKFSEWFLAHINKTFDECKLSPEQAKTLVGLIERLK